MPRIRAESVAAHVAQQEAAVFDAAIHLFLERGYQHVSLGDIAAEVGLARNSLYRYYPDKAHILMRWFRLEVTREADTAAEILAGTEAPLTRIDRWVAHQLAYARRPEHALLVAATGLIGELDEHDRAELADAHRRLLAPLDQVLHDAGVVEPRARRVVVDLVEALILGAAAHEARGDRGAGDDPLVLATLHRAIHALVSSTD